MIYFTSDTHFYHKNIIEFCHRPVSSVEEMNDLMIKKWNERITPDDIIYHLGDFFWCNGNKAAEIIAQLNGKIRWVRGNHDSSDHIKKCGGFVEWVKDYHEEIFDLPYVDEDGNEKISKQLIVMCHYPIYSWNRMVHGSWMVHGHCHGSLGTELCARYDAGVDYNNMAPISLNELASILVMRSVVPVDHHNPKPHD